MEYVGPEKATHKIVTTDGATVTYVNGHGFSIQIDVDDRNKRAEQMGLKARYTFEAV